MQGHDEASGLNGMTDMTSITCCDRGAIFIYHCYGSWRFEGGYSQIPPPISFCPFCGVRVPPAGADRSIEFLDMDTRVTRRLESCGIETLADLLVCDERSLAYLPNIGPWSICDIKDKLAANDLLLASRDSSGYGISEQMRRRGIE